MYSGEIINSEPLHGLHRAVSWALNGGQDFNRKGRGSSLLGDHEEGGDLDAQSTLGRHHYDELQVGGGQGEGAGCHRRLFGMVVGNRMWNFCYHAAKRKPGILEYRCVLRMAFLAARGRQLQGASSPHSGRTMQRQTQST